MHWEARFCRLAAAQEGAVGIDQLPEIGCDGHHWARARASRRWHEASSRVLLLDGSSPTTGRRVHAALLDAGGRAVLHGASALAWLGVRGFDLSTIHVTRRRNTTSTPSLLAEVHRLRHLQADDVVVVRGVPTVTALRAIWSEASRYSNPRWHERGLVLVGRLLDDANRLRLLSWGELHDGLHRLGRSGRAGTRLMRELADQRPAGTAITESRNEDRLESILATAGSAPLQRQVVVGRSGPIGRCDHRDPALPLVVETNSLTFHSLPSDRDADERRYAELVAAGFTVAVVWEDALWSHPPNVVDTIGEARRRARAGTPAVVHSDGCPWPDDPARVVVHRWRPPTRG